MPPSAPCCQVVQPSVSLICTSAAPAPRPLYLVACAYGGGLELLSAAVKFFCRLAHLIRHKVPMLIYGQLYEHICAFLAATLHTSQRQTSHHGNLKECPLVASVRVYFVAGMSPCALTRHLAFPRLTFCGSSVALCYAASPRAMMTMLSSPVGSAS